MRISPVKIYFNKEEREEIKNGVNEILSSGFLTLGKYCSEFERRFANFVKTKYALVTNSGTSSLECIFRSIGVKGGSVIVPTNTFIATPVSVLRAGAKILFADCDETFCISPKEVSQRITKNTKAVVIVHIGGIIHPRIKEIRKICDDAGVHLIEDACHAHGSTLKNRGAGSFGTAAAFSFYPTKVMTSCEGGMITTDDKKMIEKSLILRDQGKKLNSQNIHLLEGYNWRMSELHALIGLTQLSNLKGYTRKRRAIAKIYDKGLENIDGIIPLRLPKEVHSNYYKYIALLERGIPREEVRKKLKDKFNISLGGEVYNLPCHLQPIFKSKFGNIKRPVAESLCKRHICLPLHPFISEEEAGYMLDSLNKVLNSLK